MDEPFSRTRCEACTKSRTHCKVLTKSRNTVTVRSGATCTQSTQASESEHTGSPSNNNGPAKVSTRIPGESRYTMNLELISFVILIKVTAAAEGSKNVTVEFNHFDSPPVEMAGKTAGPTPEQLHHDSVHFPNAPDFEFAPVRGQFFDWSGIFYNM